MTPTMTAAITAGVFTVLASMLPVDATADRSAKSWVQRAWFGYRLKLGALQLVGTAILSLGAQRIGWTPANNADGWTSIAFGVTWSAAAVAALRAEVTGFNAGTATPGFSLLRSFSGHFSTNLTAAITNAVNARYKSTNSNDAKAAAFVATSRIEGPLQNGKPTPAQIAIGATVDEYEDTVRDLASCKALIAYLVTRYRLARLD